MDIPELPDPDHDASEERVRPGGLYQAAQLMTLFVGVAAILLSVWEGCETRKHNRLSVMPHLQGGTSMLNDVIDGDSMYQVQPALRNAGLGPAVIERVVIFLDDTLALDTALPREAQPAPSVNPLEDLRQDLRALPFVDGILTSARGPGAMIQSGDEMSLIRVQARHGPETRAYEGAPHVTMRDVIHRRSFVYCYCSVYGDHCQQATLGRDPPDPNVCGYED